MAHARPFTASGSQAPEWTEQSPSSCFAGNGRGFPCCPLLPGFWNYLFHGAKPVHPLNFATGEYKNI
jgi:hypothetical protein